MMFILACGTSFIGGSVAKYWLESMAKILCNAEIASEYRYRDSVPNSRTFVVTISQSGETADTLAALKLKEISYIHAEAYAAGKLKHGPLALVKCEMPIVTVAPNGALLEKLKSNMQEVRARGGVLYVLADGDTQIESAEGLRDPHARTLRRPLPHSARRIPAIAGVSHGAG
jgi:glucosamine 6-phosphate synthetase-like amidotransferase/phosphosugar isomerase protein